ncbi:DUF1846 domain-containing protein, partial [Christensenellaceae bacterium OttesenSCG-928-L17]|nr:DUF1846 domain-containing protein [Christensenellaceae bacterium OttesenSCG-928-L17]
MPREEKPAVIGFDHDKYVAMQSEHIRERIGRFGGKLYLEFGGKLFDDYHASRVLPGFKPDSKVNMLLQLREQAEVVIVINAADIEKNKRRGDLDISYDLDVLRLIDAFRGIGLYVGSVVITQYHGESGAALFQKRLENLGIRVFCHYSIPGYPANIPLIVSDEGYGKNDYIETTRSLVIVTAPGPGSGKMAACLSQLYHDAKRGIKSGYAKFETFPIWNIPLKHPVNLAYEAATADLNDVNMIDPFHLEEYGVTAVNYNRDVEVFPVLRTIFERIEGTSPYRSPTDMGVNMAGYCITDDAVVTRASRQEILRRHYIALCDVKTGTLENSDTVYKLELLLNQSGITADERPAIQAALDKAEATGEPASAIQLADGRIITGKTSPLLGPTAAMLINALKTLGNIQDDMYLLSPIVIEPIQNLKIEHFGSHNPRLHTDEILLALSICAATNPAARLALDQLHRLRGCDAHASVMLSEVDRSTLRKLGIYVTCEPV